MRTGCAIRHRLGFVLPPLAAALMLASACTPVHAEDARILLDGGKPIFDARYRLEHVDQKGRQKDAEAHTVRLRAGFETGRINGIGGAFDVEWIEHIGAQKFNDTINGDTRYPVVADPDDFALNQLYLISDGTIADTRFKIGRQRVIWDSARFIGNVGFRQNEQTFDAARLNYAGLPGLEMEYLYLEEVHRVFGRDSAAGRLKLNGHGLRARYRGFKPLTITPFALFLDYDRASQAANSTGSYGLQVDARQQLNENFTAFVAGGMARQDDHGNNPADFNLWYYNVEPGLSYGDWRLSAGIEQLDGNGTQAFSTPLATLHKFNGVTDQFLTTPTGGLRDLYGTAKTTLPVIAGIGGIKLFGAYHQFSDDDGSADYGNEWSLGFAKSFATSRGPVTLSLQYADYEADTFATDIDKLWLTVSFKLKP
ncbi:MAG: alginate export family protein [Proteobacteria bacterium]|nr:alginate export family protein [Pseudomonadota bacterium]